MARVITRSMAGACALGWGLAIATGAGIAAADPTESSGGESGAATSDSSSRATPSSTSSVASSPANRRVSRAQDVSSSTRAVVRERTAAREDPRSASVGEPDPAAGNEPPDSDRSDAPADDVPVVDVEPVPISAPGAGMDVEAAPVRRSAPARLRLRDAASPALTPSASRTVAVDDSATRPAEPFPVRRAVAPDAAAAEGPVAAPAHAEPTHLARVHQAAAPGGLQSLVTSPLRLLSGVLEALDLPSGLAPGEPARPASVQTMLGGLDLLRRQLRSALAGRTPYATLAYSVTQTLVDISPLRTTTKGIEVYNLTGKPMTLVAYGSKERAQNGPAVGTVLQPGGVLRFEVIYNFLRRTTVKPEFAVAGDPASTKYFMELITTEFNEAAVRCTTSGGSGQCFAGSEKYILGSTVSMVGAAGSQIVVEANDAATQSRFLNSLCNEDARTSCTFTPTSEDRNAYTDKHEVSYEANNGVGPLKRTITISDTQSQTDSVTVTAKISRSFIDKIVNLEISVAYGHTWTGSHTFTKSYEATIPAGYASVVYAENPVYRVYGDFQMLLPGDTKVVVKNTTWETPDPKRAVKYEFVDVKI